MNEETEQLFTEGQESTEQQTQQQAAETPTERQPVREEKLDGTEGEAAKTAAVEPAAPPELKLSAESLAQLAQTMRAAQPAAPAAEPQLTSEQVNQLLNVFNATEKDIEELGLPPTAAAKLNAVLQAVVKQAVTASALHTEMLRRQIEGDLVPLRAMREERQLQSLREEFFRENKDLVGKEKVVEMVYAQMAQNPDWKPANKAAAFKDVGQQARQLLSELLQGQGQNGGDGEESGLPPRAQQASGGKMSTVLTGGQTGGTGRKPASAEDAAKKELRWLFDM